MASTTMKRIAGELGVSITTVSKVLNNHDDISPATRARVMAKVEELGYRPNAVARSLATGSMPATTSTKNECIRSGMTMPSVCVRRKVSERATAFGR